MLDERPRFSMVIQWSDADDAYVVSLPEWSGRVLNPVTHGDTYDEAVKNGTEAIEALMASADRHGEALPEPHLLVHVA